MGEKTKVGRPSPPKTATDEIEAWRRAHNVTQREMAQILGLTRGQYEGYERTSEFPNTVVQRFCQYLELYTPESQEDRTSVLCFSEAKQVYLNVEGSVNVIRCRGKDCGKLILQIPRTRMFCNSQCRDRGRKR